MPASASGVFGLGCGAAGAHTVYARRPLAWASLPSILTILFLPGEVLLPDSVSVASNYGSRELSVLSLIRLFIVVKCGYHKLYNFSVPNSVSLSTFTELCNHQSLFFIFTTFSSSQAETQYPLTNNFPSVPLLGPGNLYSVCKDLHILSSSYK